MIYIKLNEQGEAVSVAKDSKEGAISRWDYTSLEHVERLASELSAATGHRYIATESQHTNPKWDVIRAPQIGDEVSYAFNGDCYPCGKIKTISASMKLITTDAGQKFYRKKGTGAWVMDRCWSMVFGHRTERNPHL